MPQNPKLFIMLGFSDHGSISAKRRRGQRHVGCYKMRGISQTERTLSQGSALQRWYCLGRGRLGGQRRGPVASPGYVAGQRSVSGGRRRSLEDVRSAIEESEGYEHQRGVSYAR